MRCFTSLQTYKTLKPPLHQVGHGVEFHILTNLQDSQTRTGRDPKHPAFHILTNLQDSQTFIGEAANQSQFHILTNLQDSQTSNSILGHHRASHIDICCKSIPN